MASDQADRLREIDDLLASAAELNRLFPDAVLVGGTAAAVHASHRLSTDADFILPDLSERFEDVFGTMDASGEWELARSKPPVVIMGNFHGVETTLRQLIRNRPLETEKVQGPSGPVTVPTLDEMIRVKAWLVLTRNAYRDYLDLAALSDVAGPERVRAVFAGFDDYYSDVDRKGVVRDVSPCLQLARQLFEPKPHDLAKGNEAERYKRVSERWADPDRVLESCAEIGFAIADGLFSRAAAVENDLEAISKHKEPSISPAEVPPFPADTHEAHISQEGAVVVVRRKAEPGKSNARVDNPLGPAVVMPEGVRYALDGRFMSEPDWRSKLEETGTPPPGP